MLVLMGLICFKFPLLQAARSSAPDQPLGLKGALDFGGESLTLLWEPVRQTTEGTLLSNLAGYNVYRRTTPRGPAQKMNSYLLPLPIFADRVNSQVFYYSIRAVDTNGIESADSMLIDSTPRTNIIFLADDHFTNVLIPGHISDVLRPTHNKHGVSLTIALVEETLSQDNLSVRNLRFKLIRGDNKEEINDVAFSLPEVELQVGYNLTSGQVSLGAPGSQSNESPTVANATPDQLSLHWFNGVAWIKLGGSTNKQNQSVDIKSAQLGAYQLRISAPANALTLSKANVYPGLFTPNGDGFNDRVYLVLENPNNSPVQGEIFDLSGRRIAALPDSTQTIGGGTRLEWSGHDSSGAVVPSGLYMYKLEGEGKAITGTISVAR